MPIRRNTAVHDFLHKPINLSSISVCISIDGLETFDKSPNKTLYKVQVNIFGFLFLSTSFSKTSAHTEKAERLGTTDNTCLQKYKRASMSLKIIC